MAIGRRERILAIINAQGMVSLKELEHLFPSVSSMTLRRDLHFLADRGEVVRVRRGARSIRAQVTGEKEPVYAMRASAFSGAKEAVAAAALPFLEQGKTVFLDAGSTCMKVARKLPDASLTIVTHGANIALEISKYRSPEVFLLGGKILKDSLASIGPDAIAMIERFDLDVAILSPAGYATGVGFTCGDVEEGELKRQVVRRARKRILLLDQSKVEVCLPVSFAKPEDVDVLIIDAPVESDSVKQALEEIEKAGVQVLYGQR